MRSFLTLIAFVLISSQTAAAELPSTGKLKCSLGGQGYCGDGPTGICLGNRVILGPPKIFLKLDLDKNTAELNDIGGQIWRDSKTGEATIHWVYAVMGPESITFNELGEGRTIATLSNGHNTADFVCHPVR